MGFINWCQDKFQMMMRTKPQYTSVLGRKRSSLKSLPKLSPHEGKFRNKLQVFLCVVTMFCSITYGVLLVISKGIDSSSLPTYLVSLVVAGIVAICNGLSLAEYINSQSQDVPSIYRCCYQYSSEVLAFFIGWAWIVSQTSVISAVCKVLTTHVNDWTDNIPRKYLEKVFYDYAKDVPSLIFVLVFIFFILTGFGETMVWYTVFIPAAFVTTVSTYVIGGFMSSNENALDNSLSLDHISGIDEILSKSALCVLFFSGPQTLLRVPSGHGRKYTTSVLGPLNGIILIITFLFITAAALTDKFVVYSSPNETLSLVSNILCTISLCSIGIEAFFPLHFTIEDMASDGLLFRSFSKKWKPFCFPVASAVIHVFSFIFVGLMSVFMTLAEILNLATAFPLLIGSIVPYLVLIQRYKESSSWQYEPMFHTSVKRIWQDQSRRKSEEFQYSNTPGFDVTENCDISTTCVEENLSDSTSSDTDIDSIVQQYKDQSRVANMATLDGSVSSNQVPEPTLSSSFRAKFCIAVLIITSCIVSLILNFSNLKNNFPVVVVILLCIFFSLVIQSVLLCFPQNQKADKNKQYCARIPRLPWIPGLASLLSFSLLVHTLIAIWKIYLGCFLAGTLLYFLYGIRSSTAANSFHNIRTTHITLRPLPSYGNNCIPHIIPSQRKKVKSRKYTKITTGKL